MDSFIQHSLLRSALQKKHQIIIYQKTLQNDCDCDVEIVELGYFETVGVIRF